MTATTLMELDRGYGPEHRAAMVAILEQLAAWDEAKVKALAREYTGRAGRSKATALEYIRRDLLAMDRAIEGQRV